MRASKSSFQFQPTPQIESLSATKRNPRTISSAQRLRLKKSLSEFGDLGGVVFNRRSKELVGGNQRVHEFKSDPDAKITITEKLKRPDRCGTVAYGYVEANGTRYSFREVDWSPAKAKSANIAANKHGGEFDLPVVAELLKELAAEENTDLELTGFSDEELADLLPAGDDAVSSTPQFPITAKLNEDHDYVLIFTDNLTDFIFLQTLCGVRTESSYKKTGVGIGRCVPFARFLTSLHENRHSFNVPRKHDDHSPSAAKLPRRGAAKPKTRVRRSDAKHPVPS